MIPILYRASEKQFLSNGIGRLTDAVSCVVSEERNGKYELEMEYPVTGKYFSEISEGMIISAVPADGKEKQPFVVYEITAPLSGTVTVYAEHISYMLTKSIVMPFTARSAPETIARLPNYVVMQIPFEFWTDIETVADFVNKEPVSIRSFLGGMKGSLLDVYGGEYEWDRWTVKLHGNRGRNSGVTLRYGKNITELESDTSTAEVYTGVVPYAKYREGDSEEDTVITLPEKVIWNSHRGEYAFDMAVAMDFSSEFNGETAPTESGLREVATAYINSSDAWKTEHNLKVSFVALWQTDEYKDVAPLQRVNLCDTVTVVYPELGVNAQLKVVKTEFDVLHERYKNIELGYLKTNVTMKISEDARAEADAVQVKLDATTTQLTQYVDTSTAQVAEDAQAGISDVRDDLSTTATQLTQYVDNTTSQVAQDAQAGIASVREIAEDAQEGVADVREELSAESTRLQQYTDNATALITGGLGGTVVINKNADGKPIEICILGDDTEDISQADNIWRWNKNGLGFSSTGYSGEYATAMTADGAIVADLITTGTLNASLIKTGVLSDLNNNITWNLSTGEMTANALTIDSPYFDLDDTGKITSTGSDGKKLTIDKAVISGYKADGTLSASLEIGDGLFNIAHGALAIQGYVGVTGAINEISSITPYAETFLDTVGITTAQSLFLTSATLTGGGCTYNQGLFSTQYITYMTPYGTQASATVVTGWQMQPSVTYTAPTLNTQTANALTGAVPSTTTKSVNILLPSSIQTRYQYFKYGLLTTST